VPASLLPLIKGRQPLDLDCRSLSISGRFDPISDLRQLRCKAFFVDQQPSCQEISVGTRQDLDLLLGHEFHVTWNFSLSPGILDFFSKRSWSSDMASWLVMVAVVANSSIGECSYNFNPSTLSSGSTVEASYKAIAEALGGASVLD
jgi:hypothetical protein